jgi:DNA recombination protein RmuC
LIIRDNQALFEEAYSKNVVITSPSTLIPTLRIIADIWKKEKQNQNAMLIAQQAGALYDKFVGFVDDLKAIGKSIDNAKNEYSKATNKLYEGKGNIVSRAENIKLLGAKVTKTLDNNLVELAK